MLIATLNNQNECFPEFWTGKYFRTHQENKNLSFISWIFNIRNNGWSFRVHYKTEMYNLRPWIIYHLAINEIKLPLEIMARSVYFLLLQHKTRQASKSFYEIKWMKWRWMVSIYTLRRFRKCLQYRSHIQVSNRAV